MNEQLERWLQAFIQTKRRQGMDCKLTPYKTGKLRKYMFEVNGELRNIENYFTKDELQNYKSLHHAKRSAIGLS
ncbi:MAG: hypothetical protein AAGC65_11095 [Mucilaginibacter sp.]|uniref:hypothetical protein n=1 Tax=Mucilaginibacter sp. TaxID=1882438 RepID=UPI0031A50617